MRLPRRSIEKGPLDPGRRVISKMAIATSSEKRDKWKHN